MRCKKCKKEISDESIYCMWCGVAQKRDKKKAMYQRPDGLYEKSMQLDGKRVTFRGKTEKEVIKKIAEFDGVKKKCRTFSTVAEEWKWEAWERISPNSRRNYSKPYERAVEHFKCNIDEVDSDDVRAFLYELIKKGYAQKTILAHRMVLNQIFDTAIINSDIQVNPVTNVKLPKNLPRTARFAPTTDEMEIIKNSASVPFGLFALFVLHTGCRLGEALAVTGADIDYTSRTLTITRSLYWLTSTPAFKSTKTKAGERIVPIPDIVFQFVPEISKNEYLFCGEKAFKRQEYNNHWGAYQKATGLQITAHQLRHGYATLLYEAGVDLKDAQYLLGHKNIAMTMDIYTHLSNGKKAKTASQFNTFLNENTQKPRNPTDTAV